LPASPRPDPGRFFEKIRRTAHRVTIITVVSPEQDLNPEQGGWDRLQERGTSMTIKAHADNHFGSDLSEGQDRNLSRARIAGYVLLGGLLLEVVAGLIWFRGVETLASIAAIALVAGGVAGEIFFEGRARRASKPIVAALPINKIQKSEPSRNAAHLSPVARPTNFKPSSQLPMRERRKLPGRRGPHRAAA
jgi:hypothetical protein